VNARIRLLERIAGNFTTPEDIANFVT